MGSLDDFDYDSLSEAERDALAEEVEGFVDETDADDDEDDADLDSGKAETEDDADATAADTEATDGPAADELNGEVEEQPFQVATGNLEAIDADIAEIRAAKRTLMEQYESGESELTHTDYQTELDKLDDRMLALNAERAEARAIERVNQSYQDAWWQRSIVQFKKQAAAEGVDYDRNPELARAWDQAVKFLANDPALADKSAVWFLKEGHEMVRARYRLGTETGKNDAAKPGANAIEQAVNQRLAKKPKPPVTLAALPEAGAEQEGQGKFSHLDKLKGEALERALARMSKEDADEYLQG